MTTTTRLLTDTAARLAALSDTPRLDAELLLAHALGISRQQLLLDPPADIPASFAALVDRRAAGEPVAYLTGTRGFWTLELMVGPGVLIPRPDSETLMEAAVTHFRGSPGPPRVLDLGTGSGALLLAALGEWPEVSGLGIDRSEEALAIARANAERLGMADRADFELGDWGAGISERFDLILCNPPYVAAGAALGYGVGEHEPAEALFAGADGLDAYRTLAPQLASLLAPGGLALFEIGHDQGDSAAALFEREGWASRLLRDLAGRPRALRIGQSDESPLELRGRPVT